MSGGSYNRAYEAVEHMAETLRIDHPGCPDQAGSPALRRAFRDHLSRVALAMRAVEWNDSCDGDASERERLEELLTQPEIVKASRDELEAALKNFNDAVREAIRVGERRAP